MINADIYLIYIEDLPASYFEDFISDVKDTNANLTVEARENVPLASLEWMVLTAIAIYIGKPFIDAFLKRAADDVADTAYPKVKEALTKFVKKIFLQEQVPIQIVASTPGKIKNPDALLFAIYSNAKDGKHLKFIFKGELTEQEYEASVQHIFALLETHHCIPTKDDTLSQQVSKLSKPSAKEVYLLYDKEAETWNVTDPLLNVIENRIGGN